MLLHNLPAYIIIYFQGYIVLYVEYTYCMLSLPGAGTAVCVDRTSSDQHSMAVSFGHLAASLSAVQLNVLLSPLTK